jgi:GT2 family glycosyltransferase
MTPPVVDIVTPTYNQSEMTLACFRSLAATVPMWTTVRLIWVDNGSEWRERSEVLSFLEGERIQHLRFWLPENLGFVKATNLGIAASTAPYLLLLNNDTELPPLPGEDWLSRLLEVFELDPKIGLVGPRSSAAEQWQGRVPAGPGYRVLASNAMLTFFCCLIRREVIEQVGYLSEEYRSGLGDDDDYCERVKKAGWKLALRQDVTVVHHHRTTFRAVYGPEELQRYQAENLAHFRRKWHVK